MVDESELTQGQKAARTRKRRAAGKKAALTRKRRAAGRKAAATRKGDDTSTAALVGIPNKSKGLSSICVE